MPSLAIEKRVAALEEELARLRNQVEASAAASPWWDRIAGTFEGDIVYERAMRIGREYRKSLDPAKPSRKRK